MIFYIHFFFSRVPIDDLIKSNVIAIAIAVTNAYTHICILDRVTAEKIETLMGKYLKKIKKTNRVKM